MSNLETESAIRLTVSAVYGRLSGLLDADIASIKEAESRLSFLDSELSDSEYIRASEYITTLYALLSMLPK